ncbi:MAG: metal ABC transporter permease, partial [Thermoplasmata archaeon]|nr:metal ABC transporter permease [Thermoplasmata archaeon]
MSSLSLLDLPDLLSYPFFQYALIGGCLAAVACALVGVFTLLRKEAMIGDGIAHASFGGIALGLYLGIYPIYTALLVSVVFMLAITYLRRKGIAESDAAIGIMLAFGFALGLVIISLSGGFQREIFSYLFGSILTITTQDLMVVGFLTLVVFLFLLFFYKEMLSMTFDEESARLSGIPVNFLSIAFDILVAVTIVLSIKAI